MTGVEIAKARFFPETVFGAPQEIVACVGLSISERLSSLVSWRAAVARRIRTARESADGKDRDTEMLERIDDAIDQVLEQL